MSRGKFAITNHKSQLPMSCVVSWNWLWCNGRRKFCKSCKLKLTWHMRLFIYIIRKTWYGRHINKRNFLATFITSGQASLWQIVTFQTWFGLNELVIRFMGCYFDINSDQTSVCRIHIYTVPHFAIYCFFYVHSRSKNIRGTHDV